MEDTQIIELFFQRTESAITQAQVKYGRLCMSVIVRILPDPRDAEECASDTYLKAWNAIPPERPRSLGAYLARIARNLALDRYDYNTAGQRSTALTDAFEELEECLPDAQKNPSREAERMEFNGFLNRFLRAQPEEARSFFLRRYWYGESVREIAEACRASEGQVKSSLFRTRNRLRDAMEKENVEA